MMGRTHAMLGISSLWLLTVLPPQVITANWGVLATCAALGALLPDLDAPESLLKHITVGAVKPFLLPAQALHQQLGHRGLLHSLLGWSIFSVVLWPVAFYGGWQPWLVMSLGYGSHLLADACTKSGIPLCYPKPHIYLILPRAWSLSTGSLAEEAVFALAAVSSLWLLLSQLKLLS
ncbi:MAG: metal-dependent hydrolase [Abitibacteriaceae bacterium]|nr:metal-dependent hydrolase [Abditibacteriaceae bacterium]